MPEKKCKRCEETKMLFEFNRCTKNMDGLTSYCKKCLYPNVKKTVSTLNSKKTKIRQSAFLNKLFTPRLKHES